MHNPEPTLSPCMQLCTFGIVHISSTSPLCICTMWMTPFSAMFVDGSVSLQLFLVVWIFLRSLDVILLLFHSILAAYAILVPTLYGNCETKLYGFRQHCMADWKWCLFRQCPARSLIACWVEYLAAVAALVSYLDFHSKGRITLYFLMLRTCAMLLQEY